MTIVAQGIWWMTGEEGEAVHGWPGEGESSARGPAGLASSLS